MSNIGVFRVGRGGGGAGGGGRMIQLVVGCSEQDEQKTMSGNRHSFSPGIGVCGGIIIMSVRVSDANNELEKHG